MKTEKQFFENLKSIKANKYESLGTDRLILYAVSELSKNKVEATFDNVVVAAFKLFPKRFSLIGFPDHPDGKRVHDSLFHCTYKTKKWLSGNAKSGYALTRKGEYFLDGTKKVLRGEVKLTTKRELKPKRKEVTFINLLKESSTYKKFTSKKETDISEDEIWSILRCDKSGPEECLIKNLNLYLNYAEKLENEEVIKFLKYIKVKWSKLFS